METLSRRGSFQRARRDVFYLSVISNPRNLQKNNAFDRNTTHYINRGLVERIYKNEATSTLNYILPSLLANNSINLSLSCKEFIGVQSMQGHGRSRVLH